MTFFGETLVADYVNGLAIGVVIGIITLFALRKWLFRR